MKNIFKKYSFKIIWIADDNTCTPFTFETMKEAIDFIQKEMDGNMERLGYWTEIEGKWIWERD